MNITAALFSPFWGRRTFWLRRIGRPTILSFFVDFTFIFLPSPFFAHTRVTAVVLFFTIEMGGDENMCHPQEPLATITFHLFLLVKELIAVYKNSPQKLT
jgi:hypothetical protein